jgi:hypothetical protein
MFGKRHEGSEFERSKFDLFNFCPYGKAGDTLWLRESCRAHELTDEEAERIAGGEDLYGYQRYSPDEEKPPYGEDGIIYCADNQFVEIENTPEACSRWVDLYHYGGKKRKRGARVPPIHMPRWASRITLRISNVRVERLQEIADRGDGLCKIDDIEAEGLNQIFNGQDDKRDSAGAVEWFSELWDSINGKKHPWESNPWVWVLEFELANQPLSRAGDNRMSELESVVNVCGQPQ